MFYPNAKGFAHLNVTGFEMEKKYTRNNGKYHGFIAF